MNFGFNSDYQPARPSDVILEIVRRAIESREMVIGGENTSNPFIIINTSVHKDIDNFVQRYCDNDGSTINIKENE